MTDSTPKPDLCAPRAGKPITRNEIMDVLADESCSARTRKTWLREVLTRLVAEQRARSLTRTENMHQHSNWTIQLGLFNSGGYDCIP